MVSATSLKIIILDINKCHKPLTFLSPSATFCQCLKPFTYLLQPRPLLCFLRGVWRMVTLSIVVSIHPLMSVGHMIQNWQPSFLQDVSITLTLWCTVPELVGNRSDPVCQLWWFAGQQFLLQTFDNMPKVKLVAYFRILLPHYFGNCGMLDCSQSGHIASMVLRELKHIMISFNNLKHLFPIFT